MRVLSWNINGLRSVLAKAGSLKDLLESLNADIICFQEIKLRRTEIERELAVAEGWESFFAFSPNKPGPGYSGVATFCRVASASIPVAVEQGLTGVAAATAASAAGGKQLSSAPGATSTSSNPTSSSGLTTGSSSCEPLPVQLEQALGLDFQQLQALDAEGRALVTDHGPFLLVNLYGPALTSEERLEERLNFKLNFYKVLEHRLCCWLAAGRAVLVVGDLNISPQPIDSCDPNPIPQFRQRPDRVWLNQLLGPEGPQVVDVFRHFHPHRAKAYTCWNTATGARLNNYGTRIDHILAAGPLPERLAAAAAAVAAAEEAAAAAGPSTANLPACPDSFTHVLRGCDIMPEYEGSDHAPVWVDLDIPVQVMPAGHPPPARAGSRLFPGKQASLKAWLQQQPKHPQQQQQQCTAVQGYNPSLTLEGAIQQQKENSQPGLRGLAAGAGAAGSRPASQQSDGSNQMGSSSSGGGGGVRPANTAKRKQTAQAATGGSKQQKLSGGQTSLMSFVRQKSTKQPAAAASTGGGAGVCGNSASGAAVIDRQPAPELPQPSHQQEQQQQGTVQGLHGQQELPAAAVHNTCHGPFSLLQQPGMMAAPSHAQQQQQALAQGQAQHHSAGQQQQDHDADAAQVQQALADHHQQTIAAWQRISRAMQPPNCHHGEACAVRTVKKKGANSGRQFFVCARPDGPFPVGRCDYFMWANERRAAGEKGTK